MNFIEILMISIGLAMDAFAVSICKGISCREVDKKKCIKVGVSFGGFQALMPIFGFYIGAGLRKFVFTIDHFIVFGILVVLGANMIYECFCGKKEKMSDEISYKSLVIPAIATSIDALSVGITFAFLHVNVWIASFIIGIVAFIFSSMGVYIGNTIGSKGEKKAQFLGGIILIFMGIKVLIEHFI